ncbi:hypothetical protein JMM81_17375 [Bacillus sp. V3B]|nr:hypothetical protein [Bacillus sp. V3B]
MPLVAAAISKVDVAGILLLNAFVALCGFTMMLIVFIRSKRGTVHQELSLNEQAS